MAQPSSPLSSCPLSPGLPHPPSFPSIKQQPISKPAFPASPRSFSRPVPTTAHLPTSPVSTCMYLAPLPIQSCYVTPSASVGTLLLSLRERNPHFCCVLELIRSQRQNGTLLPASLVPGTCATYEARLSAAAIPGARRRMDSTVAEAHSFTCLDAALDVPTMEPDAPSSEKGRAMSNQKIYVGWVGEFLSSTDEVAFSAAMDLSGSPACDTEETYRAFLPLRVHSKGTEFSLPFRSSAAAAGRAPPCSPSRQFLGLSTALCGCYGLRSWEPVRVSFVHLNAIFAPPLHFSVPTITSKQQKLAALSCSVGTACPPASSLLSSTVDSNIVSNVKKTPSPPSEHAATSATRVPARAPAACFAYREKETGEGTPAAAAAEGCGNFPADQVVAGERERAGETLASETSSREMPQVLAHAYLQLARDIAPASIEVRPLAEEDWEVVQLQSVRIEEELLMQIAVVMPSYPFPMWPSQGYAQPARLIVIPGVVPGCKRRPLCEWAGISAEETPLPPRADAVGADELNIVLATLAAGTFPQKSTEDTPDAAVSGFATAYPPFFLLRHDTELHVQPYALKLPGQNLLPSRPVNPSPESEASHSLSSPTRCAENEKLVVAEGARNGAATPNKKGVEAWCGERSHAAVNCHTVKDSAGHTSVWGGTVNRIKSIGSSGNTKRNMNINSSHGGDEKASESTAEGHHEDVPLADSAHMTRLEWDREGSIVEAEPKDAASTDVPPNAVPSFRMRVVATNSRHLCCPSWVSLLQAFRPIESSSKTAKTERCTERYFVVPGGEKESCSGVEGYAGGLKRAEAARVKSVPEEITSSLENEGDIGLDVLHCKHGERLDCEGVYKQESAVKDGEMSVCANKSEHVHLRPCYACWIHPCHVVALQNQQPWLQASLRQDATAGSYSRCQRILDRNILDHKSLLRRTDLSCTSPLPRAFHSAHSPSCRSPSTSVGDSFPSAGVQQSRCRDATAYVWVSLVVPPERRCTPSKATNHAAAAAGSGLRATSGEQPLRKKVGIKEGGEESASAPPPAAAAGEYLSTLSTSWEEGTLSGLVLLKAFPDGRVAPGSVALPLHIRRIYSFPLCSFVFVTPCTSLPTLPRAIVVLPLCPSSLTCDTAMSADEADLIHDPLSPQYPNSLPVATAAAHAAGTEVICRSVFAGAGPQVSPSCDASSVGDLHPVSGPLPTWAPPVETDMAYARCPTLTVRRPALLPEEATCPVKGESERATVAAYTTAGSAPLGLQNVLAAPMELSGASHSYKVPSLTRWRAGAAKKQPVHIFDEGRDCLNKQGMTQASFRNQTSTSSLLEYLRTSKGKQNLQGAIYRKLRDLTVESSNISCTCTAGLATAAATVPGVSAPTTPLCSEATALCSKEGERKDLLYYDCCKGEPDRECSTFPFALWEGAVLQVSLVVPEATISPASTPRREDVGGEVRNRRPLLRKGRPSLPTSAITAANTAEAATAAKSTVVKISQGRRACVRMTPETRVEVSARRDRSNHTCFHEEAETKADSVSQGIKHCFGQSALHQTPFANARQTSGVPLRKTRKDREERLQWSVFRGRSPVAGESPHSSAKMDGCCEEIYKKAEGKEGIAVLEEGFDSTLREGLQDLYLSCSTESDAGIEGEYEIGSSDMSVDGARRNNRQNVGWERQRTAVFAGKGGTGCDMRDKGAQLTSDDSRRSARDHWCSTGDDESVTYDGRLKGEINVVLRRCSHNSQQLRERQDDIHSAGQRGRRERALLITECSSATVSPRRRAAQAAWAREALFCELPATTEGDEQEEDTADDEHGKEEIGAAGDDGTGTKLEEQSAATNDGQLPPKKIDHSRNEGCASCLEPSSSHFPPVFCRRSSSAALTEEVHFYSNVDQGDRPPEKRRARRFAPDKETCSAASLIDEGEAMSLTSSQTQDAYAHSGSGSCAKRPKEESRRSLRHLRSNRRTDALWKRRMRFRDISEDNVGGNSTCHLCGSSPPSQKEKTGSSSVVRVVRLDVVVAFRSAFVPCESPNVTAGEAASPALPRRLKQRSQEGKVDMLQVRGRSRSRRSGSTSEDIAGAKNCGITLPQVPTGVLPMSLSLAGQSHPLDFLLHKGSGRRARSFGRRSLSCGARKGIMTADACEGRRKKTSLLTGSCGNTCRQGENGPAAFVMCDPGFLQKCEQGKIPLQVLEPLVLLHASSSTDVFTLRASVARTAIISEEEYPVESDSETGSGPKGGPPEKMVHKRELVTQDDASERGVKRESSCKDSNSRLSYDGILSTAAAEGGRIEGFHEARKKGKANLLHPAANSTSATAPGLSGRTHKNYCVPRSDKQWRRSIRCSSSVSTCNGSISRRTGWDFPPCLVLDTEQQSLSYTQWWLCDAILRSRRAAAAAAAADQLQVNPGSAAAAELLHLIQLQCVEQLNPDLLGAAAGPRQRYVIMPSRQRKEAMNQHTGANKDVRVFQYHLQRATLSDAHTVNTDPVASSVVTQSSFTDVLSGSAAAAAAASINSAVRRAPRSCVMYLPRHAAAVGKPQTPASHRLVIRDLSFLAEGRPECCQPFPANAGAKEAGCCFLAGAQGGEWQRKQVDADAPQQRSRLTVSFLESLVFHRQVEEDEEDEDTAAGDESACTLFLRCSMEVFEDCPARLVRASESAQVYTRLKASEISCVYRPPRRTIKVAAPLR